MSECIGSFCFLFISAERSDADLQKDRSVILPRAGIHHIRPHYAVFDALADQEIVDPPSAVVDLARSDPLGPPGIGSGHVAVHFPEGVHKTGSEQTGKAFTLLVREARGHVVALGMREVDFPVGYIIISAGNDRLFAVQLLQIVCVFLIPDLPFLQAAEPVTGVGSMRRVLPDGRQIFFIVNHSMGKYSSDVRVKCSSAVRWDMFTGERCALDGVQHNGYFTFRVELERCESLLFVTDDLPAPAENAPAALPAETVAAE